MLCQQTLPKRWFANVNMTSYCDVANNVYPVTMTTIRRCSILGFGRGESNQAVAPGTSRPLHATVSGFRTGANDTVIKTDIKHQFCIDSSVYEMSSQRWLSCILGALLHSDM